LLASMKTWSSSGVLSRAWSISCIPKAMQESNKLIPISWKLGMKNWSTPSSGKYYGFWGVEIDSWQWLGQTVKLNKCQRWYQGAQKEDPTHRSQWVTNQKVPWAMKFSSFICHQYASIKSRKECSTSLFKTKRSTRPFWVNFHLWY
jgi:hypothetical protein